MVETPAADDHPHGDEGSDNSGDELGEDNAPSKVRGARAGGRFWKNDRKRFSSIVTTRHRPTWEKKKKLRSDMKHNQELSRSVEEERARIKKERRERRQENLKRREENARKSEIVQVIKNTSKIKKMKRKQLRNIQKRDTTVVSKS